jgi:hypothetical protein
MTFQDKIWIAYIGAVVVGTLTKREDVISNPLIYGLGCGFAFFLSWLGSP